MNSLLKLLPVMIRLSGDNEQVREQAVFAAWRAAAGEGVANVCEPSRLHNKNLTVAVLDQTWKNQMEKIAAEYVHGVNKLLNGSYVGFIDFRVDRDFVIQSRREPEKTFEFHHTQEIEEELESAAAKIKDEDLREKFLRAAAKSLERRGE
ncbi:MAG: DUF721 domain-containing protein [Acidobacteria bacterium]|nr:DUF721 domain-containing protein [Acidobacteriota bacterium]